MLAVRIRLPHSLLGELLLLTAFVSYTFFFSIQSRTSRRSVALRRSQRMGEGSLRRCDARVGLRDAFIRSLSPV